MKAKEGNERIGEVEYERGRPLREMKELEGIEERINKLKSSQTLPNSVIGIRIIKKDKKKFHNLNHKFKFKVS